MGIEKFFAENIILNGKEAVEILIEGEDKDISDFYKMISSKFPNNAKVSEIKKEEYKGRVMSIEGYYRYLTASQLSKIATYGGKMLEKQDETIAVIKEEGEKTRRELGTLTLPFLGNNFYRTLPSNFFRKKVVQKT